MPFPRDALPRRASVIELLLWLLEELRLVLPADFVGLGTRFLGSSGASGQED